MPKAPPKKPGPKGPRRILGDTEFEIFKRLIEIQCPKEEICGVLGMSDDALFRCLKQRGFPTFEAAVERFGGRGKMSLRRLQWAKACEGNTQMMIWLGKQWLNQSDKVDNTSSDGSMSPPKQIVIRGIKADAGRSSD